MCVLGKLQHSFDFSARKYVLCTPTTQPDSAYSWALLTVGHGTEESKSNSYHFYHLHGFQEFLCCPDAEETHFALDLECHPLVKHKVLSGRLLTTAAMILPYVWFFSIAGNLW